MFSTQSTSVMSIGAITSPCSAKTEYHLPSLCEMADTAAVESSQEQHQKYLGHWIHNNGTNAPPEPYPTHPMMRNPSSSSLSNRSRFPSLSMSSPSFSSSSSNASDHEEEEELHHYHHRHLSQQHHPYQHSRQNSLFSNFESTFSTSSNSNNAVGRSRSFSNKSDALATRRARNKLASAKYRAKKQALTHAMQDRIMQLATQVMNLREELKITKTSELEIKARYERLMQYHNTFSSSTSPATSMAAATATATTTPATATTTTTTTTRLY
ncbi:hypothetical protein HMPREF1544_09693 [Mucor circinelloides 1006PhL]|uniref:BZIP domain-containing protein n=1 Tax=Mucor circinelloides f. circinelloides (strain 1006PhL) TaxID=1220926 RepID=S2J5P6_MUCC1|nr:hypothetical protein HMPREF1544_09693 [Mucor circinelloides 1006PhL]KAG1084615.1 hypothetical protein G6F42_021714 [Rhizopus arrhizus]